MADGSGGKSRHSVPGRPSASQLRHGDGPSARSLRLLGIAGRQVAPCQHGACEILSAPQLLHPRAPGWRAGRNPHTVPLSVRCGFPDTRRARSTSLTLSNNAPGPLSLPSPLLASPPLPPLSCRRSPRLSQGEQACLHPGCTRGCSRDRSPNISPSLPECEHGPRSASPTARPDGCAHTDKV